MNAIGEAARKLDRQRGTCHRVRGDLDVLLTEVPFRFRRPDVVMYRFLPDGLRGRWRAKPYDFDVLVAVEIVSAGSQSARRITGSGGTPVRDRTIGGSVLALQLSCDAAPNRRSGTFWSVR